MENEDIKQEQLLQILRNHQLRKTKVRMAVLSQFLKNKRAVSHADMEVALPNMDRITLYRTLKTFVEKGVIHQAIDGTNAAKYALCHANCDEHEHHDNHAHFHCTNCGDTMCLDNVAMPKIQVPQGYLVVNSQLVLEGICLNCN